MQKMKQKSAEAVENKRLMKINNPKKISKVKDARRLLANLIYLYQKGEVSSEHLKTLCYALIKYSELYKTETLEEFQERLTNLEKEIQSGKYLENQK